MGFFLHFSFGRSDMYRKRVQICVFILVFLGLFSALAVLFYVYPVKCDWCEYLTCIPITDKFCEKYDLNAHLLWTSEISAGLVTGTFFCTIWKGTTDPLWINVMYKSLHLTKIVTCMGTKVKTLCATEFCLDKLITSRTGEKLFGTTISCHICGKTVTLETVEFFFLWCPAVLSIYWMSWWKDSLSNDHMCLIDTQTDTPTSRLFVPNVCVSRLSHYGSCLLAFLRTVFHNLRNHVLKTTLVIFVYTTAFNALLYEWDCVSPCFTSVKSTLLC